MPSSDEESSSSSSGEESTSDASADDIPTHWRVPPRMPSGASVQSCSAQSSEDDEESRRPRTHKSVKQSEAVLDTLWALNVIESTSGQTGWIELGKALNELDLVASPLSSYRLSLLANNHSKPRLRDQARAKVRVLSRREWPAAVTLDLPQPLSPGVNDILLRLNAFLLTQTHELNLSNLSRKQQRLEDFHWRGWLDWLGAEAAIRTRCQQVVFCNNGFKLLPDALLEVLTSVRCIVHRTNVPLPYWPIMYARLPRLRHIHLTYAVELTRKTSLTVGRPHVSPRGYGAPSLQQACVQRLLARLPRYEPASPRLQHLLRLFEHSAAPEDLLRRLSRCYTCQACDALVLDPTFAGNRPWLTRLGGIGSAGKKQVKGRVCGLCAVA